MMRSLLTTATMRSSSFAASPGRVGTRLSQNHSNSQPTAGLPLGVWGARPRKQGKNRRMARPVVGTMDWAFMELVELYTIGSAERERSRGEKDRRVEREETQERDGRTIRGGRIHRSHSGLRLPSGSSR